MLTKAASNYYELSCHTKDNMEVRKAEFLTEVLLSVMVTAMIFRQPSATPFGVAVIGLIHSFNAARAFEAYKEAQQQTTFEQ